MFAWSEREDASMQIFHDWKSQLLVVKMHNEIFNVSLRKSFKRDARSRYKHCLTVGDNYVLIFITSVYW